MTQAVLDENTTQLCTFLVGDLLFGVDVTQVQEVIRHQEITPVPLSPTAVSGLINLRGQIVTAVEMRDRLALKERGPESPPMNVVLRRDASAICLLVDEIGDVVEVDDQAYEPPPETLDAATKTLIRGVYKLDSQLLLLLNTQQAVSVGHGGSEGRDHGK